MSFKGSAKFARYNRVLALSAVESKAIILSGPKQMLVIVCSVCSLYPCSLLLGCTYYLQKHKLFCLYPVDLFINFYEFDRYGIIRVYILEI